MYVCVRFSVIFEKFIRISYYKIDVDAPSII